MGTLLFSLKANSSDAHFVFYSKRKFLLLFSLSANAERHGRQWRPLANWKGYIGSICNEAGSVLGVGETVGKCILVPQSSQSRRAVRTARNKPLKRQLGKVP